MSDAFVPPSARELEGLLKAGNVDEFKHQLRAEVFTNMEWHQADTLLRDLGQMNEADRKTQAGLPAIELIDAEGRASAGIKAVALTTLQAKGEMLIPTREIAAGVEPFHPHVVDPRASSAVGK